MLRKILFGLGLLLTGVASAQALPAQLFDGLSWRFVGPYRGGRTLAVTGVPSAPATWYFGSVDGGVFKSTDNGTTWTPLFQHQHVSSIGAIAVAPSNPNILYVGTGETAIRSDTTYGDGMYRSDDGGETWRHIGLDDSRHIGRILVAPEEPDSVLVAALGHVWGPNQERGVFLTTDGGRHWQKTLYVNPRTGAIDLARDPDHPASVYAVTWSAWRPPWFQYAPEQGQGSAIYHSGDGGRTWSKLPMQGLPADMGRVGIAVAGGTAGPRLYAIVSAGKQGGLYRSDDGGNNWRLMDDDARLWGRAWYFGRVTVDPKNPDVVYVPNTALYRSTDGGAHFTAIKGSPDGDDYQFLWINPQQPKRMILSADQGVAISFDGGAHWTPWYNQPTAQIYHVSTDNDFPYHVYGTQQDSGAFMILSRSWEGLITSDSWSTVGGGGESGYIFPRKGDPDILYGSGYGGSTSRYDVTTHQTTDISPVLFVPFGVAPRKYYFPWNTALAVSPFAPDTLYVGAQVIFRSTDGGDHWQVISPTLTGRKPGATCIGDPTLENAAGCGYSVIYALAPSPVVRGVIWAGTDDSRIWISSDDGAHWRNVSPPGLKPWSRVDVIEADPNDAATAYAAIDRHGVNDFAPYIYVTHDYGKHWMLAVRGIPVGDYVRVVRADPVRKGLLYAGTEEGAFVSFDDGANWQSLQLGLPTVSVHDLDVHGADLVAATHGRGVWILDDIEPLREASATLAASAVHLYRPEPAVRLRPSEYHGESRPIEVPHAFNPPTGAIIDYYLKETPRTPISLSIYDAGGTLVRRYASNDQPAKMPVPNFRDIWEAPPTVLPDHTGNNRFVWDLRYTPPATLEPGWGGPSLLHGTPRELQSPLVAPGNYRVVLNVNSRDYAAPLTVLADPNVKVPSTVIAAQVKLGLLIRDAIDRSTHLILRARAATAAAEKSGDTARARRIRQALIASGLEDANGRLEGLLSSVNAADTVSSAPISDAAAHLETQVQTDSATLATLLTPGT
ncbi:MAG: WD40/YVTN/BNR-like repeat-containing protein [Gammaproteobacteria bacterium]